MLTQCPHCLTIFRVTGQILRMGHGQVRCGRCTTQFDALDRLLDDDEESGQTGQHGALSPTAPPPTEELPNSVSLDSADAVADRRSGADRRSSEGRREGEDEFVGVGDVPAGGGALETDFATDLEEASRNLAAAEANAANRTGSQSTIVVDEPEALEEITMEGKRIEITGLYPSLGEDGAVLDGPLERTITEEWANVGEADDFEESEFPTSDTLFEPDPKVLARPEDDEFSWLDDSEDKRPWAGLAGDSVEAGALSDASPLTPRSLSPAAAFGGGFDAPITANGGTGSEAYSGDIFAPHEDRVAALRTPLWAGLSVLALVLLLAQIVHHYRHELVRHPQVGPMVSALYNVLGLPLAPDWNPAAYDVQQWGAAADTAKPGTLKVRATIANRAAFAQPYPLLRLVLEDRWGDQVGVRDFQPREYLQPGVAPDRLLGPAQKTDAEIVIVDPGQDAVGFHLDICLPREDAPSTAVGGVTAAGAAPPVCANEPRH